MASAAYGIPFAEYTKLAGNPDWIDPSTGGDCKAYIIVWYRNHQLVEQLQKGF